MGRVRVVRPAYRMNFTGRCGQASVGADCAVADELPEASEHNEIAVSKIPVARMGLPKAPLSRMDWTCGRRSWPMVTERREPANQKAAPGLIKPGARQTQKAVSRSLCRTAPS